MADYMVIMVNPDQLDHSPHQPESRLQASGPMRHLQNSIKDVGLLYPPLVIPTPGNRYQIVDGHRRVAAMNELGWPKIPVLPTQGKPDDLFAAASGNVAKMKATEWVVVHLKGGVIPPGPTRGSIQALEKHMGRGFLERLSNREPQVSPSIWTLSHRVLRYLELDEKEHRAPVLEWLLNSSPKNIAAWITNGYSISELRKAYAENRKPVLAISAKAA